MTQIMHMQMHLTSVVREYGPLYASGLFAFERYNGVLGDINTNNRQIEGQIMSWLMEAGLADSLQDEVPMQYESHFAPLLKSMKRVNLSVAETIQCFDFDYSQFTWVRNTEVGGCHTTVLQRLTVRPATCTVTPSAH